MKLIEGENAQHCSECGEFKSFDCFHKAESGKYGYRRKCKCCRSKVHYKENKEYILKQQKEYNESEQGRRVRQKYYEENKETILEKQKEYREENKEHYKRYYKEYWKKYYQENRERESKRRKEYYRNNKQKILEYGKEWRQDNKQKLNEYYKRYFKERRKNDVEFKILCNLRNRTNGYVTGKCKSKTTRELLGCSVKKVRKHLEDRFEEGMAWGNYGDEWHIDHIIPCSTFDLEDEKQQHVCFHYTNLQPLWAEDNLKKADKIPNLFKNIEIDEDFLTSINYL